MVSCPFEYWKNGGTVEGYLFKIRIVNYFLHKNMTRPIFYLNIPFIAIVEWFLTGNKGRELANSTEREMFLHLFYACEIGRGKKKKK